MEIFTNLSHFVCKFVVTKNLYCYGDLSFQKGCEPGGGGEETRSGTEKRCSHNLQSGHRA